MASTIITSSIWQQITKSAKASKGRSFAAVAYFGKGGASMLPLKKGSILIVDASELSVKTGRTCPAELLKLYNRGVRIFNNDCLHAKVFLLNSTLYIGSTNVSHNSSVRLQEAVFTSKEKKLTIQAKQFILSLCSIELGPERINQLHKIYRPPIVPGGNSLKSKRKSATTNVYVCRLRAIGYSKGHEEPLKQGKIEAKKRRQGKRRHVLQEFEWSGNRRFKIGDIVIQVTKDGQKETVSPPGTVVFIKRWNQNRRAFIFLEIPDRNEKGIDVIERRIDKRLLSKSGKKNSEFAASISSFWN